jgi:hypothetical protein
MANCRRTLAHLSYQLFAALSRTNPPRRQTPSNRDNYT